MVRLKKVLGIYADVVYPAILFLFFHVEINKSNHAEAKSVCMEWNTVKHFHQNCSSRIFSIEWRVPIFNNAYQIMIYNSSLSCK